MSDVWILANFGSYSSERSTGYEPKYMYYKAVVSFYFKTSPYGWKLHHKLIACKKNYTNYVIH